MKNLEEIKSYTVVARKCEGGWKPVKLLDPNGRDMGFTEENFDERYIGLFANPEEPGRWFGPEDMEEVGKRNGSTKEKAQEMSEYLVEIGWLEKQGNLYRRINRFKA